MPRGSVGVRRKTTHGEVLRINKYAGLWATLTGGTALIGSDKKMTGGKLAVGLMSEGRDCKWEHATVAWPDPRHGARAVLMPSAARRIPNPINAAAKGCAQQSKKALVRAMRSTDCAALVGRATTPALARYQCFGTKKVTLGQQHWTTPITLTAVRQMLIAAVAFGLITIRQGQYRSLAREVVLSIQLLGAGTAICSADDFHTGVRATFPAHGLNLPRPLRLSLRGQYPHF